MPLKFEMVLQDYCRKKKNIMHSCSRELVTNIFALQSVCWNPCQEVWVGGLGMRPTQVIVLCSWAKHFTLSGSLSNQAPVIWRVDCAIHWICHPLVDTLVGFFFYCYPQDSDLSIG